MVVVVIEDNHLSRRWQFQLLLEPGRNLGEIEAGEKVRIATCVGSKQGEALR